MKLCNIIKNDVAAIWGGGINPFIPPLSTPLLAILNLEKRCASLQVEWQCLVDYSLDMSH